MGIQGSLMSYFTEPIYFSSIILGSLYHADHLSRAMYQRIADIEDLPQQFSLNRPLLSGKTTSYGRGSHLHSRIIENGTDVKLYYHLLDGQLPPNSPPISLWFDKFLEFRWACSPSRHHTPTTCFSNSHQA